MYNQLFGINPVAPLLLALLGLDPKELGRLRDAYISIIDGKCFVNVFTRNGGPNREAQDTAIQVLLAHPWYLTDFDDAFDGTYATFTFTVPDDKQQVLKMVYDKNPEQHEEPMQKFKRLIDKMQGGNENDPEVKKAMEVGKRIIAPIIDKLKTDEGGVVAVLDHDFKR